MTENNNAEESMSFPHAGGQGVCLIFDDKIGNNRKEIDLHNMVKRIREIANEYGFDIDSFGNDSFVQKAIQYYSWKIKEPKI